MTSPVVVIRPITFAWLRVNHRSPAYVVIIAGNAPVVPIGYVDTVPSTVMRPIESLLINVHHKAPSGPTHSPYGAPTSSTADTVPSYPIRPTRSSPLRVNHTASSGPSTITLGRDCG